MIYQYRRRVLSLVFALVVLLGLAGAASAPARAATSTGASITRFSISGNIAGGVKIAGVGEPVVFSFRMKNIGTTTPQDTFLVLTKVSGWKNPSLFPICVDQNGNEYNPSADGNICEFLPLKPGQSAGLFAQLTDAGTAGGVVVRACVERPGFTGPCLTLSVSNG